MRQKAQFYLNHTVMSFQDGVDKHLVALFLHQHHLCGFGWQGIAANTGNRRHILPH